MTSTWPIVVSVLVHLLWTADSLDFGKKHGYIKRTQCMYGYSNSTPLYDIRQLDNPVLLYYQLDGVNDTVRYIWSLAGTPTLFISVTPAGNVTACSNMVEPDINISDWEMFVTNQTYGSVTVPDDGGFTFSIVFNHLIEFRDDKYKASKRFNASDLSNSDRYRLFDLQGLDWTFEDGRLVAVDPSDTRSNKKRFKWTIQLYVPDKPGRISSFPKTLYSENSTVFDFVFSNFNYTISTSKKDSQVKYGRLVLEMLLVHGELNTGKVDKVFSRDDEYTPSVFLTYNKLFGGSPFIDGFLQWKPISYLSHSRKSTQSQQANINTKAKSIPLSNVSQSFVTTLYSDDSEAGTIQPVYMVYGTEGDDNNPNPGYVTWTGMLGFGKPPQDSISFVVILTICIGLGVPALLIGLGGVFLFIRRKPWQRFTSKASIAYSKLDVNGNDSK